MEKKILSKENNRVKIEYSFNAEELNEAIIKAYKKNKSRYIIPGFRKGKAPRKMIEMHYGEGVFYEDAVNILINENYDDGIYELELKPISQPEFDLSDISKDGAVFTAEVDVEPEVTLGKYKELEVKKEKLEVLDEDVDKVIESEREKNARLVPSEDAVKEGDTVTITIGEQTQDIEVSSNGVPKELNEALIGLNVGDKKEVTIDEETLEFEILEVKVKELPELDDDFVMDISEFDTLDEYKADIKEKMLEARKNDIERKFEFDALTMAIDNMEVDVPEKMVENYQDFMLNNFKSQITSQGLSFEDYLMYTGMSEDKIKEQMKENAEFQAKEKLLIDAIVVEEQFEVSEQEIDEKIEELAKAYDKKAEEVKDIYKVDDFKYLKEDIIRDKARKIIVDTAESMEE